MKITDRIALYFTLIGTSMLLIVLVAIYLIFMKFLQVDFFDRLTDRTMVTAKLYLEADEISKEALNDVRHRYMQKLNDEIIRIYDYKDRATFIGDTTQYWTKSTIEKVRNQKQLQFSDGQRQVVGIYYKDNQGDFVILASADDQGSRRRLEKLRKIMAISFFFISIIILLSSRWVAEKMLKPLKIFSEEVKQIDSKNMGFRVRETDGKDEINLMAKSFNHLMDELEQAFLLQKTFVSNASHELRTPITRIMMTSELALSKGRDAESYREIISSILEDAEKMGNITNGLVALAKMDLELINSQVLPIALDQLLVKIKSEWQQHRQLQLLLDISLEDTVVPLVNANSVLLQIALDNIIANAFKFSDGQPVNCRLTAASGSYQIQVEDKGIGLSNTEIEELFRPFHTKAKDSGHSGEGMGLYMALKIIDLFKGSIEVTNTNKGSCTFTVNLPEL